MLLIIMLFQIYLISGDIEANLPFFVRPIQRAPFHTRQLALCACILLVLAPLPLAFYPLNVVSGPDQEGRAQTGKDPMGEHVHRPLSAVQQEGRDRRYTAICAVDFRPFNLSGTPAFRWYLDGSWPPYVKEIIHHTNINHHKNNSCA